MIWTSTREPVEVGGTTLPELVLTGGGTLIDGPTGQVVDGEALRARAGAVAATLAGRGIGPGDVVALLAPNMPAWAGVALGAMATGAAVTPLSMLATERELAGQLADSGAKLVVTIPPFADRVGGVPVLTIGPELLAGGGTPAGADPDAVALIPYSSGTTGLPKGVLLTHSNLVTSARQSNAGLQLTERDVVLAVAPYFHIMGFMLTMAVPLAQGSTVVTMPRFDPAMFFELIERHRVTCLVVPPPVMPAVAASDADLSSVEMLACGGAPLAPAIQAAAQARLPHAAVGQGWGLTESTVGIAIPDRAAGGSRPGTVGTLMPNTELRVVDGELWARGPQIMAGYLGRPDATAATVDSEGWLHTGDLGHVDEEGNVVVSGRLKELIKVNAFQVAPAELEALLVTHPAVADTAVVGQPDDACGEVPVAFVVARGDVDGDELCAWLAERVAPYKRLGDVRFVDEIPRTPSGKILRRLLSGPVAVA